MTPSFPVHIIGTGGGHRHLTLEALEVMDECTVLFASQRLKEQLAGDIPHLSKKLKALPLPISEAIKKIEALSRKKRVGVLVSGDPLYYSIGKNLLESLGRERCVIHPGVSIAQVAFSKLKLPWDDALVISLHGRGFRELERSINRYRKIGIYTDPNHNPVSIAEYLLARDFKCASMCVLEDIGGAHERIRWFNLKDVLPERFKEPNFCVLVMDTDDVLLCRKKIWFGMPETFYTEEKIPITKREVRAVVLSRLELTHVDLCMWDIGAGTGSISIEASRFIPLGIIYAIEKDPHRVRLIRNNLAKFDIANVVIVDSKAPDCMALLPEPDRVFVGGGSSDKRAILARAIESLKPGGKIVVSCVMLNSLGTTCSAMEDLGLDFDVVEI